MAGEKDKIAGRVKQAAGDLTDDEELAREGEDQESAGKVKEFIDDASEKLQETVDKIRKKVD